MISPKTEKRPNIICAPVLTFTQADANYVAGLCPYEYVDDKENILFVIPSLTKETIEKRQGILFIVHHVKDKETGETKIAGEWQTTVPILQTANKNIFYCDIRYDGVANFPEINTK